MKLAIVSDSTCDLPDDVRDQHQIQVVPNILVIDGQSIEDSTGVSRTEFYERLPHTKNLPTTAAASAGSYEVLYESLLTNGASHILSIHPAATLSGIFNSASLASSAFPGRVTIIDSGQLSLGVGYQVLAAAEMASQGLSLEQVISGVHAVRQRLRVVAMLDTLEFVRRSGRVSWVRARIGSLLDIKPFVELKDGQVLSLGQARTRHKGVQRMVEMIRGCAPLERLAILHTNALSEAQDVAEQLRSDLPIEPWIVNVTTVIGTHVGPNALGFAALRKPPARSGLS